MEPGRTSLTHVYTCPRVERIPKSLCIRINITEGVMFNTLLFCIQASDADVDSKSAISFELINGNGRGLFHVEPDTGHVRVANSLADKDGSKYTLEITASDGGKKSATNATVNVSMR